MEKKRRTTAMSSFLEEEAKEIKKDKNEPLKTKLIRRSFIIHEDFLFKMKHLAAHDPQKTLQDIHNEILEAGFKVLEAKKEIPKMIGPMKKGRPLKLD